MTKQFHEYQRIALIPAGEILRHPEQRKTVLRQFTEKFGAFDHHKCLDLIHLVKAPKGAPVAYYAVNGATRVESCTAATKYGKTYKLQCKVYGNGVPPTSSELAELFLITNTDHIAVSSGIALSKSIDAGRPSAVAAQEIIKKLGGQFQGRTGVWSLVKTKGASVTDDAAEFCAEVWPEQRIPMTMVRAVAELRANDDEDLWRLLESRIPPLRRKTAETWALKAKAKMNGQQGTRDSLATWIQRVLLGRRGEG